MYVDRLPPGTADDYKCIFHDQQVSIDNIDSTRLRCQLIPPAVDLPIMAEHKGKVVTEIIFKTLYSTKHTFHKRQTSKDSHSTFSTFGDHNGTDIHLHPLFTMNNKIAHCQGIYHTAVVGALDGGFPCHLSIFMIKMSHVSVAYSCS